MQDLAAVLLVLVVLLTLPLGQVVSSATEVETWVGGEAGSVQKNMRRLIDQGNVCDYYM